MERQCLECGEKLYGRVDKKFCSDQCRSSYNNKQNMDSSAYVRKVNQILKKNRRILEKQVPQNKGKAAREKLLELGFNFNYFTNTLETKDGRIYYYCYDYGYFSIENDWYALVKKLDWIGV
tara:strand:+ start:92 stop:454 length:363 start_codon:yes stop_codon:yes gene_type:complete